MLGADRRCQVSERDEIDNSGAEKNTSWYKAFLGQRITDGLEKGIYVLTFYAKAKEAGTPVSVYTQIGIILLVALSAKNGILIVEFARDFRAEGNSIREAAYEAGHVRLRPILMTSFAFVLGVMPFAVCYRGWCAESYSVGYWRLFSVWR